MHVQVNTYTHAHTHTKTHPLARHDHQVIGSEAQVVLGPVAVEEFDSTAHARGGQKEHECERSECACEEQCKGCEKSECAERQCCTTLPSHQLNYTLTHKP